MEKTTKVLGISFIANFFLSISKIVVGILGTSQSLIADGMHSFSDLATDIVSIVGNKFASRPADFEHPFGHGKLEYITSMFISIVILGLGFTLIKESLFTTTKLPDVKVLILVVITIIVKTLVAGYLLRSGKKMANQILISSGKESFMDVLSSILVLFTVILSQFQKRIAYFAYADKVGGILIGCLILFTGFLLLKENISILIDKREEDKETIELISTRLNELDITSKISEIILMKYGPYYHADIIISMRENQTLKEYQNNHKIIHDTIKEHFPKIKYIHIQLEMEEGEKDAGETRSTDCSESTTE